jgi:hypothetical protein
VFVNEVVRFDPLPLLFANWIVAERGFGVSVSFPALNPVLGDMGGLDVPEPLGELTHVAAVPDVGKV